MKTRELIQALRDTIESAHDVHIYHRDDEHPDDCEFCAIVADADKWLAASAPESGVRIAPAWAWETIDETLALDSESCAFDRDLREQISRAFNAVEES